MTDEEIKKGRDKIAKLMNMTVENGCSEDEAANAMRMAAGIAARLGIALEAVRPAGEAKPKIKERYKAVMMKVYEAYCAEAAGILYGVECVAPNYGKNGFWYTGREDLIELAEQTQLWLVQQVEQLYKQALPRGLSKKARADFRGSFKDACGERLRARAFRMMRDMKNDEAAAQAATGQNALVVAGYFEVLRKEIATFNDEKYYAPARRAAERAAQERQDMLAAMPEADRVKFLEREEADRQKAAKKAKPYKAPRTRNPKRGTGTQAGWEAGDRVQLRREIR